MNPEQKETIQTEGRGNREKKRWCREDRIEKVHMKSPEIE